MARWARGYCSTLARGLYARGVTRPLSPEFVREGAGTMLRWTTRQMELGLAAVVAAPTWPGIPSTATHDEQSSRRASGIFLSLVATFAIKIAACDIEASVLLLKRLTGGGGGAAAGRRGTGRDASLPPWSLIRAWDTLARIFVAKGDHTAAATAVSKVAALLSFHRKGGEWEKLGPVHPRGLEMLEEYRVFLLLDGASRGDARPFFPRAPAPRTIGRL